MKAWMLAAAAAASLVVCGTAAAQFKNADDAIEYRQGALAVMGHHFGLIGAMVNNKVPYDAKAVLVDAELVATLSKLPWPAFVPGSDKGDTSAKPEIWSEPDKFKAANQRLQDNTAKLLEAAKSGNQDAVKAAFGETGQACKSCHDDFRKKH